SICSRDVRFICVLAELQRANIGCDGPAVRGLYLGGVVRHSAKAVADHIIKPTQRRVPEPLYMERRRTFEAALHNHSVSITQLRMAGLAINVVALLAARKNYRNCFLICAAGQLIAISIAMFAAEEITVGIQLLLVHIL